MTYSNCSVSHSYELCPAPIRGLSMEEIDLVSGAVDWGAVWDSAIIGGYAGMAGGAAVGAVGTLATGGALAPAIIGGAALGGLGGLVGGAATSLITQTFYASEVSD